MTKFLATLTETRVIFREIKKPNRNLALVYDRLYRIDNDLFCSDIESADSFIPYDLDEQQPWGRGKYLDPDNTKVLIDSMRLSKKKPTSIFDFNSEAVIAIVIVAVVAFSIVSQYLE